VSMHAWIVAWEAAMAEVGYPKARIDPIAEPDCWSYGWMSDLDKFIEGQEQTEGEWDTAHVAFLLVDHLRPEWVKPSLILQQMLEQR